MNKNKTTILFLLFTLALCTAISGCSLQDKINQYSSDKEQCYLNTENVTQFIFKGDNYTILEDTVTNNELGEWVGYIRKFAVVDESGKVLLQENIENTTFQALARLTEKEPEAAYIIPFLNVYTIPNTDTYLIIEVNGGYHKAVLNKKRKKEDIIFDFKKAEQSANDKFKLNPQNATQLICNGTIYQVTAETVSDDKLGSYLDILAKNITFDKKTKKPLSQKELRSIDWYGDNAGQQREQWFYTDIYAIYGINTNEAVAVQINNCYYVAKRQ